MQISVFCSLPRVFHCERELARMTTRRLSLPTPHRDSYACPNDHIAADVGIFSSSTYRVRSTFAALSLCLEAVAILRQTQAQADSSRLSPTHELRIALAIIVGDIRRRKWVQARPS